MGTLSVLVVDDDPDVADALRALLERKEGVQVQSAETLEGAMERIRTMDQLDLLICDLRLGSGLAEGVDLLRECRRIRPTVRRVLLTGFDEAGVTAWGIRPGDADWVWEKDVLFKAWPDFEQRLIQMMTENV